MFSRGLRALQRLGGNPHTPRPHNSTRNGGGRGGGRPHAFRGFYSAAASSLGNTGMRLAGGGLLTGGGVLVYNQSQSRQGLSPVGNEPLPAWLHSIEQRCQEVLSPGQVCQNRSGPGLPERGQVGACSVALSLRREECSHVCRDA